MNSKDQTQIVIEVCQKSIVRLAGMPGRLTDEQAIQFYHTHIFKLALELERFNYELLRESNRFESFDTYCAERNRGIPEGYETFPARYKSALPEMKSAFVFCDDSQVVFVGSPQRPDEFIWLPALAFLSDDNFPSNVKNSLGQLFQSSRLPKTLLPFRSRFSEDLSAIIQRLEMCALKPRIIPISESCKNEKLKTLLKAIENGQITTKAKARECTGEYPSWHRGELKKSTCKYDRKDEMIALLDRLI